MRLHLWPEPRVGPIAGARMACLHIDIGGCWLRLLQTISQITNLPAILAKAAKSAAFLGSSVLYMICTVLRHCDEALVLTYQEYSQTWNLEFVARSLYSKRMYAV